MKEQIIDMLSFTDKLHSTIENNNAELVKIVNQVIEKQKLEEDATEEILSHRTLMSITLLMNEDLKVGLIKLNTLYATYKASTKEMELPEEVTKRLDFSANNDVSYFVEDKGKIEPKDKGLISKIETKINMNKEEVIQIFLEGLVKSPMYKEAHKDD